MKQNTFAFPSGVRGAAVAHAPPRQRSWESCGRPNYGALKKERESTGNPLTSLEEGFPSLRFAICPRVALPMTTPHEECGRLDDASVRQSPNSFEAQATRRGS